MHAARLPGLCLAVLCIPSAIAGADAKHPAPGATRTVIVENMQFNPPQLRVRRGARIVWVNKDLFRHTVTAASRAFDSGSIAANASWAYVAAKAGEYPYACSFHPSMKGTIEVE